MRLHRTTRGLQIRCVSSSGSPLPLTQTCHNYSIRLMHKHSTSFHDDPKDANIISHPPWEAASQTLCLLKTRLLGKHTNANSMQAAELEKTHSTLRQSNDQEVDLPNADPEDNIKALTLLYDLASTPYIRRLALPDSPTFIFTSCFLLVLGVED